MNVDDLKRKQYELEREYSQKIKASPKGSSERKNLLEEAYTKAAEVLYSYRRNSSEFLDLGGGAYLSSIIQPLLKRQSKILEIGCGAGSLCIALAEKGHQVLGIDLYELCISKAQKRVKEKFKNNCDFQFLDFMEADLPDEEYDLIINDNVLEHICPDEALDFINKCKAKLKKGGFLITITPNRWIGPHDISREFQKNGTPAMGLHLKEYSFAELLELFKKANFNEIRTLPFSGTISAKLNFTRLTKAWCYKNLIAEKIIAVIPISMNKKVFRFFVSDLIAVQK